MSAFIDLPHVVPIRYLPRRGRTPRMAVERIVQPVALNEVSPSEMPEAGKLGHHQAHASEGQLWTPVRPGGGVDWLVTFLNRWGSTYALNSLDGHTPPRTELLLGRSPLLAIRPGWTNAVSDTVPPDVRPAVVEAARETARVDLARYLEDNLRKVGNDVFVRLRGPLLMAFGGATGHAFSYWDAAWVGSDPTTSTVPSRIGDAWQMRCKRGYVPNGEANSTPSVKGVDILPETDGIDDLLHFVNTGPEELLRCMPDILKDRKADAMHEMAARLAPMSDRGLAGGISRMEVTETAEILARSAEALCHHWREAGHYPAEKAVNIAMHAREYVLPALTSTADLLPEDERAFDDIGAHAF